MQARSATSILSRSFAVLLSMSFVGCCSLPHTNNADAIVGRWICRDLSEASHISHFKGLIFDFKAMGDFEMFYVEEDGSLLPAKAEEKGSRWSVADKNIRIIDEEGSESSRITYRIEGGKLHLTLFGEASSGTSQEKLMLLFKRVH